ncbi:phosphoribosylaminoimidazolesuccinocarboxamide synthase, partial [Staphylococcus pseudintermedius]|uniref:phosphoribosylaminoimidazolesuccinocarboxamide synthase n=1 Tax=Staphylococcus pseudintermedius TaxID=283734 RepID=UPI0030CA1D5F
MTADHVKLVWVAEAAMMTQLKEQALRINQASIKLMYEMGLALVECKIELGVVHDRQLSLAVEISPHPCRIRYTATQQNLDTDVIKDAIDSFIDTYHPFI